MQNVRKIKSDKTDRCNLLSSVCILRQLYMVADVDADQNVFYIAKKIKNQTNESMYGCESHLSRGIYPGIMNES